MKISSCIEKIRKILCYDVKIFDLKAMYLKVIHGYGKLYITCPLQLLGSKQSGNVVLVVV